MTRSTAYQKDDRLTGEEPSPSRAVSLKSWLAVLGAAIGAFMAVLDIQIVNSSLADIQGSLGATVEEGTWIATSYLVAEIVTIPLTAWLSRVFSIRRYLIVNAILFILFSIACAFAWDLNSMIVFRAAQGFFGGTLIPMAMTIILTSLPKEKHPIGLALFGLTATFAPSIGPALGGWLTYNWGWKFIFYLNVIPGLLFLALLAYALPKEKMQLGELIKGDWLGIISMALGLGCLEVVLEEGNRKDWFGSELIVKLALVAAVSLIVFVWRQLTAKKPLLNLRLLKRRNFGLGSVANVALGAGMYGSIYLIPVYLASIQDYNSLQIGSILIYMGLPQLLIIPFIPKLLKIIDARLLLGLGLILFAASSLMNGFMTNVSGHDQLIPSMLVRALGQPLIMIPLSTLATGGIEKEETGSASALFNMMRNLGGSVGIALISTFVTRREQFHSSRIGESISIFDPDTQNRIQQLTTMFVTKGFDQVTAHGQAIQMLDNIVRRESFVMAYNDAFLILGFIILASCLTVLFLKKVEGNSGAGAH